MERYKKPRILVVDDDPQFGAMLKRALETEAMEVRVAESGREMQGLMDELEVDVVLLDINLPDDSGFVLARALKQRDPALGLIFVSGRNDPVDRVAGLELGADDYLDKPVRVRELIAKVRNLASRVRVHEAAGQPKEIRLGRWKLDRIRRRLETDDGEHCTLTHGEYRLLESLAMEPGKTRTRDELYLAVSGGERDKNDRTVDVLVARLRRKLEDDSRSPQVIRTVPGEGYALVS